MTGAPDTASDTGRDRRSPLLLAGLLLLLLLAGLTYQLWQARQEAIDTAKRATHSMTQLLVTLKSLAGQVGGLRLAARFKGIDEKLGAGGRIDRSFLDSLREEFRQLRALLDDWKANEKV